MITSVVFDMDGVLFDTERVYIRAWRQVAEAWEKERPEFGENWPMERLEKAMYACIGRNGTGTREYFNEAMGEEFPYDPFFTRVGECYWNILDEEGVPLMKGAREILEFLTERGAKIALATSTGRKTASRNLERAGLASYFQEFVFGDMVEHGKPDPEIYRRACGALGTAPENCIAVEDSYNGIRSAYRAGMKPVMVPDLLEPTDEIASMLFWRCDSLHDLKERMERLAAENM